MMETTTLLLLRAATVFLGGVFVAYATQAYRKHRSSALAVLAVAIGLMALGAAIELVAYLWLGAGLGAAEVLEASVTLLAFVVLLWSIRAQRH